jgi:(2R)-sulfolactate sulfo-lyase subunit alpha
MGEGSHHFLAHSREDNVGVAVRDIQAGETVRGVLLEGGGVLAVEATELIPFGHKLALCSIRTGDSVRRYGKTIGHATAAISAGAHVHVHNLKSNRF